MSTEKMGVAIVGCGAIFQNHIDPILKMDNTELLYLIDIDKEKVKKLALQYECDYSTDMNVVLEDDRVDVIHILTPHYLHFEMTAKAIEAKKHVVLEKPAAINVDDVHQLIELSKKKDKQIAVVFQNRYNPSSAQAKAIIDSGKLGKVKGIKAFVTWQRDEAYYNQADWRGRWKTEGGGLLINQAIHTLDLMQWFGGDMDEIKGHVDTRLLKDVIEVEDTAEATIKFKNGAVGVFYGTNNYADNSAVEIEVIGDKGKLKLTDNKLWLEADDHIENITSDSTTNKGKNYWGNSHRILIDKVYDNISKSKPVDIDISHGLKSLEMIHGIYTSSKSNSYYQLKR